MSSVRGYIKRHLKAAINHAVISGMTKAEELYKKLASSDISPATWKAICKRNGIFRNRKCLHDWNEAFAEVFLEPLAISWNYVFHNRLQKVHQQYSVNSTTLLKEFAKNMEESMAQICGSNPKPVKDIIAQAPLLEDQINTKVMESLKFGKDQATLSHQARSYRTHASILPRV